MSAASSATQVLQIHSRRRFNLLRFFTIASLAIIVVVTIAALLTGAYLVHNAYIQLEKEEAENIAIDVLYTLAPLGLEQAHWPRTPDALQTQSALQAKMQNFDIVEFLIVDRNGKELARLQQGDPPERALWNEGLANARHGHVSARWESPQLGPLVLFSEKPGWIETYVPIHDGSSVVGVARVQRNLDHVIAQDHRMLGYLMLVGLFSAILIFFALRYIVAQAHKVIRQQQVEIEKITAQVSEQNDQLIELNRRKDEFVAICSHDVRSPLNGIYAGCQLLLKERKGPLNAFQRDVLESSQAAAKSVIALTNGLLDLARIEEGKEGLIGERFALAALIQESIESHKAAAEVRGATLSRDIDPPDLEIHSDRTKVLRICNNLISNAVKHSAGTPVRVVVRKIGEAVNIGIHDQGPGIRPEDLYKLFDRFSALARHKRTRDDGTGLGLSITRALVDLLGGTISVSSEVGKGSSFSVTLPLRLPDDRVSTPVPMARALPPPQPVSH
jgi:signal transduction histidine kinase